MQPPTTNLQPGSTGSQVQQLQQYLVSQGYMTQADMNTGPGTYGPKTTTAVATMQKALGVNAGANAGYYGPLTISAIQKNPTKISTQRNGTGNELSGGDTNFTRKTTATKTATNTSGTTGTTSGATSTYKPPVWIGNNLQGTYQAGDGIIRRYSDNAIMVGGVAQPGTAVLPSTGDPQYDNLQNTLAEMATTGQVQVPTNLVLSPTDIGQFLSAAHQVVDPQTQQFLKSKAAEINTNLQNLQTNYQNQAGQKIQQFGTDLANQANTAAGGGMAFSGFRGLQDRNLMNTTNRDLSTLGANTAANIGGQLQAGGSALGGSSYLSTLNNPNLNTFGVDLSNNTGINTKGNNVGGLNYNYNPSTYGVGSILTSQGQAVGNRASNLQQQYYTNAVANPTRSISDLMNMTMSNPQIGTSASGYSI